MRELAARRHRTHAPPARRPQAATAESASVTAGSDPQRPASARVRASHTHQSRRAVSGSLSAHHIAGGAAAGRVLRPFSCAFDTRGDALPHQPRLFLAHQRQVNPTMRTTLVGWLVQVFDSPFVARLQSRGREHALHSALFLTIDLTDRFLSVHQVDRSELMLLGLCALRLAVAVRTWQRRCGRAGAGQPPRSLHAGAVRLHDEAALVLPLPADPAVCHPDGARLPHAPAQDRQGRPHLMDGTPREVPPRPLASRVQHAVVLRVAARRHRAASRSPEGSTQEYWTQERPPQSAR
mmetsp:Transcript_45335/g.102352  ORF Transcript_45335/g.102352 Transcript_45335/m.102352 type:complete len:294 (+) Transcript_45335:207-1088(+)